MLYKSKSDLFCILDYLERFQRYSGLTINRHKTKLLQLGKLNSQIRSDMPFEVVDDILLPGIKMGKTDAESYMVWPSFLLEIYSITTIYKCWRIYPLLSINTPPLTFKTNLELDTILFPALNFHLYFDYTQTTTSNLDLPTSFTGTKDQEYG